MQPIHDDRRAFDRFLELTRRDCFRMYELLRDAQRSEDMPMSERLARLNGVASAAWDVYAAIAELNAAIWPLGDPGVEACEGTARPRLLTAVR